jgi:hypothetical protein
LAELNATLNRISPFLLLLFLVAAFYQKFFFLVRNDGGGDLLYSDIPKSLMFWKGQDPYMIQPYAAPYPPFFMLLLGGIIHATQSGVSPSLGLVSLDVRLVGLLADLLVGILIFLALRGRGFSGLGVLVPTALYLGLPSISWSPYFFWHSDVFGYPILAGAVLALSVNRLFAGSTLLALATVFKFHPVLALPLVLVWIARRKGLRSALPSLVSSGGVLFAGMVLPLGLPGYANAVIGFNVSNGLASGTSSFSIMNLFYGFLPSLNGLNLSMLVINQVWIVVSAALFVLALGRVWSRAGSLEAVDVVVLGLLVWLLPLRELYTHYMVWMIVPFLMRGRWSQSIIVAGLLELANTTAVWSWNIPPNPFPWMTTAYGFFLTSIAYASVSAFAMVMVLKGSRGSEGSFLDPLKI